MTDKDMFERLGKHLFFLTQDADKDVLDRWKEIGLTQEFANFIVTKKNQIEAEKEKSNVLDEIHRKTLSEAFSKIHASPWIVMLVGRIPWLFA